MLQGGRRVINAGLKVEAASLERLGHLGDRPPPPGGALLEPSYGASLQANHASSGERAWPALAGLLAVRNAILGRAARAYVRELHHRRHFRVGPPARPSGSHPSRLLPPCAADGEVVRTNRARAWFELTQISELRHRPLFWYRFAVTVTQCSGSCSYRHTPAQPRQRPSRTEAGRRAARRAAAGGGWSRSAPRAGPRCGPLGGDSEGSCHPGDY